MKRRIGCPFLIVAGLVALVGVWAGVPALAIQITLTANFDGGGSDAIPVTDVVDAYPGMPGDHWASEWKKATYNSPTLTDTVLNTSPLSTGGGNYLSTVMEAGATLNGRGAVGRGFIGDPANNPEGIDVTKDHTISFKYRIDEDLATFSDVSGDFLSIWDYTTVRNGSTSAARWYISANGTGTGPSNWNAQNGNYDGTSSPVDTGIALQHGVVYDFTVNVRWDADPILQDPSSTHMRWDLAINNGSTTWNSTDHYPDGMGWRGSATAPGGYLNFLSIANTTGEQRKFSVDSLTVTGENYVPPPPAQPGPYLSPVVARFTQGNTDTEVDGYRGLAGNGWRTSWTALTGGGAAAHTVVSPSDLNYAEVKPGSGNYLSFSATGTGGIMNATVTRSYMTENPDPGITWTREHTIQFTMRIDEDVDNEFLFTDADDKYLAFQSSLAQNGTNSLCVWQAMAYAVAPDPGMNAKWLVSDGNNDGTYVDVNTGIGLVTDGIYDFTIIVDPKTLTYDAIISDGTTTWDSRTNGFADGLGWRTAADNVGGYLGFGARGNATDDVRAFSLDDVVISQSPPPPAIPGDTDGNGIVDADDAAVLAQNWGANVGTLGAEAGDFNGDELVNAADASILAANWGNHNSAESSAAVPEPSAAVLLLGVIASFLTWRRP